MYIFVRCITNILFIFFFLNNSLFNVILRRERQIPVERKKVILKRSNRKKEKTSYKNGDRHRQHNFLFSVCLSTLINVSLLYQRSKVLKIENSETIFNCQTYISPRHRIRIFNVFCTRIVCKTTSL